MTVVHFAGRQYAFLPPSFQLQIFKMHSRSNSTAKSNHEIWMPGILYKRTRLLTLFRSPEADEHVWRTRKGEKENIDRDGQSHKVIQVLYVNILSIMPNHTVCVDLWCCLRSLGQLKRRAAVQKSATGGWWLFSCCRVWWNYAEMHCSKYVLLLVDRAFQT